MWMTVFECPKCKKRLAYRHNLSRHKKNCVKRIQQQLCNDILAAVKGKRPINPDNVSFDGIISGFCTTVTNGHPENPKIDALHLQEHQRSRVTSQHNLKVEKLPTTAKGLYSKFKILHCQFLCHGKY